MTFESFNQMAKVLYNKHSGTVVILISTYVLILGTVDEMVSLYSNPKELNYGREASSLSHLKLQTTGIMSGLLSPPFVIRMCPPLTVKNFNDYRPLLAVGATNGSIQVNHVLF